MITSSFQGKSISNWRLAIDQKERALAFEKDYRALCKQYNAIVHDTEDINVQVIRVPITKEDNKKKCVTMVEEYLITTPELKLF